MPNSTMFSVAIPTKDRANELIETIRSISQQSIPPTEVLIIDDSRLLDSTLESVRRLLHKHTHLRYICKNLTDAFPGSAASKNLALNECRWDVVFILDDDVYLESRFFENALTLLTRASEDSGVLGVGGVVTNARSKRPLELLYNWFFLLTSTEDWDITNVGFQVWDDKIQRVAKGYYIHGCIACLIKSKAIRIGYRNLSKGRTALEDVDFCLRAKQEGYHFLLSPYVRAVHSQTRQSRERKLQQGVKTTRNRRKIFQDNVEKTLRTRMWFFWSMFGWILRRFLCGDIICGIGMLKGLLRPLSYRPSRSPGSIEY